MRILGGRQTRLKKSSRCRELLCFAVAYPELLSIPENRSKFQRLEISQNFCRFMRIVNINHCNRVVAVINVQDFAGNGFAERRQQSQSGTADLFLRNVCLQRRVQLVPAQNLAEIADAGSGQRFNRAGGNRIDADFLLSHINRGITYRSFQRSFGNAIIL